MTQTSIAVTFIFYNFSSLARFKYLFIFSLLFQLYGLLKQQNPLNDTFFSTCQLTQGLVIYKGLGDPLYPENFVHLFF